nr:uncharacterized protein At3g49140-like [Ipomoea batatas]
MREESLLRYTTRGYGGRARCKECLRMPPCRMGCKMERDKAIVRIRDQNGSGYRLLILDVYGGPKLEFWGGFDPENFLREKRFWRQRMEFRASAKEQSSSSGSEPVKCKREAYEVSSGCVIQNVALYGSREVARKKFPND